MRFKWFLLDESPAGVGGELFFQSDSLADVTALRQVARTLASQPGQLATTLSAGARGRKVCVREVEEGSGTSLRVGDTFDSAQEASTTLGFGYNAVSYALKKARIAKEKTATIKGVTLCYLNDLERVE